MKRNLIEDLSLMMLKQGYMLKTINKGFDILARKGEKTFLIKVLKDANAANNEMILQMKNIASYINGSPMIIAESAGVMLEDNVVYSRNDVITVNLETFRNCLQSKLPFFRASNAGFTATLDSKRLREVREQEGYSVNALARRIGVSRTMVHKYENEASDIAFSNALKIYDMFGEDVFNRLDIFTKPTIEYTEANSDVSVKYASLGFNVLETFRTPFDIVARKNEEVILTSVGDVVNKEVLSLSKMLDTDNLLVFNRKKPKVESPVIARNDFLEFEEAKELLKFVREF